MAERFIPPSRIEIAYRREMDKLLRKWISGAPRDATEEQRIFHFVNASFRADAFEMTIALASRMVRWVNAENMRSWRAAAAKSQRPQMLYRALQRELSGPVGARLAQIVSQNAELIRSIPQEVAQKLAGDIAKAQQQGARAETIMKMLQVRFPELTSGRIHQISRTEVSKASTALTESRSEDLNLPAFIWDTSEDQRVRPSHRKMDGVVVFWKELPSPEALIGQKSTLGHYAPGNCPNCRCGPRPVLTLDDIYSNGSSTARVYYGGRIVRMTRAQFAQVSGIQSRVAA